ncbi:hypothetical protein J1N35_000914 [Gossypium stocksii]|uniref:Uncharacterized protein n=1 Tax=Gossypium stocksii TaxID=47602 RepID=A0A9D3WID0_9ROSI|nr:hypothetical protein J1N35_000914 [Gossypium stocksii]
MSTSTLDRSKKNHPINDFSRIGFEGNDPISAWYLKYVRLGTLWGGNSFIEGLLTDMGHKPKDYSSGHISYRRTDGLLFSTRAGEGTCNTVLEGDNEDANEEGDVGTDANEGNGLKPEPIR